MDVELAPAAFDAAVSPVLAARFGTALEVIYRDVDALCTDFCLHVAHSLALDQRRELSVEEMATELGIAPEARFLLRAVVEILREDGLLIVNGPALPPCENIERPAAGAIGELVVRCRDGALDFLRGRRSGVGVVFPRGDLALWERVHREDAVMSIYADLTPPALECALERSGVARGANVLEVGAGVGAVLDRCLPQVQQGRIEAYWFTDLGKVFVQRAAAAFESEPRVRYAQLDLDRPLAEQGMAAGSFDAILGVNVLHAVRDLAFTLRQLRELLRPGGHLILGEGSPPERGHRWRLDVVFAFLPGWWDVRLDPPLRPRSGFLFPEEWLDLLRACGFAGALALPGERAGRPCRGGLITAWI